MIPDDFRNQLQKSLHLRQQDPALSSSNTYRIFNGFYEGLPGLVVDRYANTILISNHSRQPESLNSTIEQISQFSSAEIPGIDSILLKTRHSTDSEERKGRLLHGQALPQEITEHEIRYAINLRLNQDDSFYPDTRNLRHWLLQNSKQKSILNCFAYTGSLGIAALAGAASAVVQNDINSEALSLAEKSYQLNNFSQVMTILKRDFFSAVNALKKSEKLFDIVILDSPFFSSTRYGKVDLQKESVHLINKVRPLVAHEGRLIVINNALYVSGKQFIDEINDLCKTGYVAMESIITIPSDITGYPETITANPPVDPAPFNHPTKICVLKVLRKDQKLANF
jgi:23S rRNA (cytosine1962-C5)-methyltransferase